MSRAKFSTWGLSFVMLLLATSGFTSCCGPKPPGKEVDIHALLKLSSSPSKTAQKPPKDLPPEIREFIVKSKQVGCLVAGDRDLAVYPAEAGIILTGTPEPAPRDKMYRANLLFYKKMEPPYIARLNLEAGILWIYLPMSDFEKIRDLSDAQNGVKVSWTRYADGKEVAGIIHN
jgi:hypothetical protein